MKKSSSTSAAVTRVEISRPRPTARLLMRPVTNPTDFDVLVELSDGKRGEGEVTLMFDDGQWYACTEVRTYGDPDPLSWVHGITLRRLMFTASKELHDELVRELARGPQ